MANPFAPVGTIRALQDLRRGPSPQEKRALLDTVLSLPPEDVTPQVLADLRARFDPAVVSVVEAKIQGAKRRQKQQTTQTEAQRIAPGEDQLSREDVVQSLRSAESRLQGALGQALPAVLDLPEVVQQRLVAPQLESFGPITIEATRAKRAEETKRLADELDQRNANTDSLRKEYQSASRNYIEHRDAYSSMLALSKLPQTGPRDLAIVYNFARSLQDGRLTDEDFRQAANTGNLGVQAQNLYDRFVANGGRLQPQQVRETLDAVRNSFREEQFNQEQLVKNLTRIARKRRIDPRDVTGNVRLLPLGRRGPSPPPGEEDSTFIGLTKRGDPRGEGFPIRQRPDGSRFIDTGEE